MSHLKGTDEKDKQDKDNHFSRGVNQSEKKDLRGTKENAHAEKAGRCKASEPILLYSSKCALCDYDLFDKTSFQEYPIPVMNAFMFLCLGRGYGMCDTLDHAFHHDCCVTYSYQHGAGGCVSDINCPNDSCGGKLMDSVTSNEMLLLKATTMFAEKMALENTN